MVSSIGAIVVDGRVYPSRGADQQLQGQQSTPQAVVPTVQGSGVGKPVIKPDLNSPPQVPPSFVMPPSQYLGQVRSPTPTVTPPLGKSNRVSPIGAITHQVSDAPETCHISMKNVIIDF